MHNSVIKINPRRCLDSIQKRRGTQRGYVNFPRSHSRPASPSPSVSCSIPSASISGAIPTVPRENKHSLALKPDQKEALEILTLKAPIDEDSRDRLSNLHGVAGAGDKEWAGQSELLLLATDKGDLQHLQILRDAEVPIQPSDQMLVSPYLDITYDGAILFFHYSLFCFLQLKPLLLLMGPDSSLWDSQPCLCSCSRLGMQGFAAQ